VRIKKVRSGREPPGGLTWPRPAFRSQSPEAGTERGDGRGSQPTGQGAEGADRGAPDADHAMTLLYHAHYRPLVRLAALLVTDLATAEDIVQDSFAALHEKWRALPDTDAALAYLRRSVVRRSRSAMQLPPAPATPARGRSGHPLNGSAVVSALRALPGPEREVMVLRYFAELSEAEIAAATEMSPAAVRSHTARAMSALQAGWHPAGG
jgi:DNA-directed RNA polymerase specialized sigma24 family protein